MRPIRFKTPTALAALYAAGTFFSVCLVMFGFWWTQIRGLWVPDGDEFALLANSARMYHPHPLSWITRGYRDYLIVYPEITSPRSNFLRPVANIKYFLESFVFGEHWTLYLLTNYLMFAFLAATIVWIGVRHLKLSRWQAILLGVFTFLSPAQEIFSHTYPNASLDVLAAALLALSLALLLEDWLLLSFLLAGTAVFTKETAHFAPFVFSLCLLLYAPRPLTTRVKLYAALFPLPVVAIYALRNFVFPTLGVYVMSGNSGMSSNILRAFHGLTRWPFHVFLYDSVARPTARWMRGERVLLSAASAIFWLLLIATVYSLYRRSRRERTAVNGDIAVAAMVGLFLAGSLALPSLLNLPLRFGAFTFPLLVLLGLYCIHSSSNRLQRLLWVGMLTVYAITAVQARLGVLQQLPQAKQRWAIDRSYLRKSKAAPPGILLLVDDVSGFDAGTQWFQAFSRYQGQMIRVDSLATGGDYACLPTSTVAAEPGSTLRVDFPAPNPCGYPALAAADKAPPQLWSRQLGSVTVTYTSDQSARLLHAVISYPAGVAVSYMQFDPPARRYRLVQVQGPSQNSVPAAP